MTLILTVSQIVLPVFALAAIGFTWVRLGFDYDTVFVTRLAMTLAVPCLVFVALARSELDPGAAGRLLAAALLAHGAVLAGMWGLCRLLGLSIQTYLAPLTFGNTGNLGLPLALFAFGDVGLAAAVVVFSVTALLSFTLGIWLVSGGGNPLRALREPMVGATIFGALVLWQGWPVPDVVFNIVDLIGQMGIPLMLITLGVAVARLRPAGVWQAIWLSSAKIGVCAALGYGIGLAFALDRVSLAVLVVQMATPVAVTSYLLAEKYGAEPEPVAALVVVSTVMSVLSMPMLLAGFV